MQKLYRLTKERKMRQAQCTANKVRQDLGEVNERIKLNLEQEHTRQRKKDIEGSWACPI